MSRNRGKETRKGHVHVMTVHRKIALRSLLLAVELLEDQVQEEVDVQF